MYQAHIKRALDIAISFIALTLMAIPILAICIMCLLIHGVPVFYIQPRPGRHGDIFYIYKLRTMRDSRDAHGNLLDDEKRITWFGNFLRKSSIDELPGLWNVLKGDMSLVGPRPLLVEYLPLYNKNQARRHEVRPGITGLAQVNGRNAISWEEKFSMDVNYVDNISFMLDLKILLMTVKKVILKDGISHAGEATMTKFTGSK